MLDLGGAAIAKINGLQRKVLEAKSMSRRQPRKVVLASRNPDKVRELQRALRGPALRGACRRRTTPGLPDVIEDGTTIVGNATRKAIVTAAYTGEIAVADDTCLQVRELNGLPDIFAARFSGPGATYASNAELLLDYAGRARRIAPGPLRHGLRVDRSAARAGDIGAVAAPGHGAAGCTTPGRARSRSRTRRDEPGLLERLRGPPRVWRDYARPCWPTWRAGATTAARLREVADGPAGAVPARGADAARRRGHVRLPDPRIWAGRTGRATRQPPTARGARRAWTARRPGRAVNGPLLAGDHRRRPGAGRRSPGSRVGDGGFGYDPVFRPEGEQRDPGGDGAGGQERHQPPRPGRCGGCWPRCGGPTAAERRSDSGKRSPPGGAYYW